MDENICNLHQNQLWDFAADRLSPDEREAVAAHVENCRDCQLESADLASMRAGLSTLPKVAPPPMLHTRLQVIASRERSRFLLRRTLAIRFREFASRMKLLFDTLLKPLAVPATGGLLSSFLCFGVIVGSLHIDLPYGNDIPIGLFTSVVLDDPSPFPSQFSTNRRDVLVQLTVDEKGNVSDFTLPQGAGSSEDMREIGNLVLYSSFRPATRFGQPVTGKILVNLQYMRVKG